MPLDVPGVQIVEVTKVESTLLRQRSPQSAQIERGIWIAVIARRRPGSTVLAARPQTGDQVTAGQHRQDQQELAAKLASLGVDIEVPVVMNLARPHRREALVTGALGGAHGLVFAGGFEHRVAIGCILRHAEYVRNTLVRTASVVPDGCPWTALFVRDVHHRL